MVLKLLKLTLIRPDSSLHLKLKQWSSYTGLLCRPDEAKLRGLSGAVCRCILVSKSSSIQPTSRLNPVLEVPKAAVPPLTTRSPTQSHVKVPEFPAEINILGESGGDVVLKVPPQTIPGCRTLQVPVSVTIFLLTLFGCSFLPDDGPHL